MKNKSFILAGLAGLSALALNVSEIQAASHKTAPQYYNYNEVDNPPVGYEVIILHGCLDRNASPNAIVAGASDDAIYIGFNQNYDNVNIAIYNEAGLVVYNTVVNTSVQTVVIIPFTNAASGVYTLELSNANGYADGDFEKNQ